MKKPQSLAGVIRQRLNEIEGRLAVGIRQEVIIAELAAEGQTTTIQNFRNELYRARKRKAATTTTSSAMKAEEKVQEASAPSTVSPTAPRKITNPSDIRKARDRKVDLDDYQ